REQGREARYPGRGQRGVVTGGPVLIEYPLDGGLLLVLHGHVLAVGHLVRIAEAAPVIGPQWRLVAISQEPHVGRGGRVRLQCRGAIGAGGVVEIVRDDLVLAGNAPELPKRAPGLQPPLLARRAAFGHAGSLAHDGLAGAPDGWSSCLSRHRASSEVIS